MINDVDEDQGDRGYEYCIPQTIINEVKMLGWCVGKNSVEPRSQELEPREDGYEDKSAHNNSFDTNFKRACFLLRVGEIGVSVSIIGYVGIRIEGLGSSNSGGCKS